jgi:hypothetical protein
VGGGIGEREERGERREERKAKTVFEFSLFFAFSSLF